MQRVPSSTIIHGSAQPSSHPGRSDFPSPVGGDSYSPRGTFPYGRKLKHSPASTPRRYGYIPGSTSRKAAPFSGSVSGHAAVPMPAAHREPLCAIAALPLSPGAPGAGQRELPRLLCSYWLMRQTAILPLASVVPIPPGLCRSLRAPAAWRPFPTLSLRSLHGRLSPYPAATERCLCPFLPAQLRPPLRVKRIGSRKCSRNAVLCGGNSRGCNYSIMFRLPCLLGLLTARTVGLSRQPQGRIHRAVPAPLPVAGSGITTCPNPDN